VTSPTAKFVPYNKVKPKYAPKRTQTVEPKLKQDHQVVKKQMALSLKEKAIFQLQFLQNSKEIEKKLTSRDWINKQLGNRLSNERCKAVQAQF